MAGRISNNEREARKLYVHGRHRMVFTVVFSVLALILAVSIPTAMGLFDQTSETEAEPNYGVVAPCVATGTTAIDANKITVRVLNATDKSGLAAAVATELQSRGFNVQGSDNYSETMDRSEIRFGKNTVAEGYTVLGNFNDAILRMDDRDDMLIDVIIGKSFYDLLDEDQVTTLPGSELQSLKNCAAADSVPDVPAAIDHDPVEATDTTSTSE